MWATAIADVTLEALFLKWLCSSLEIKNKKTQIIVKTMIQSKLKTIDNYLPEYSQVL